MAPILKAHQSLLIKFLCAEVSYFYDDFQGLRILADFRHLPDTSRLALNGEQRIQIERGSL